MSPTHTDLTSSFPELAAAAVGKEAWLNQELSRAWAGLTHWGADQWRGALLEGAHRLGLQAGLTGVETPGDTSYLTQESVGAWSEGYAREARPSPSSRLVRAAQVAPGSDAWWGLTRWGLEWLELRGRVRSTLQFDGII